MLVIAFLHDLSQVRSRGFFDMKSEIFAAGHFTVNSGAQRSFYNIKSEIFGVTKITVFIFLTII
jgi:hypothetical protein